MATIMGSRPTPNGQQPAFQTNKAQSHPYTCNSCLVAFRNSELQRNHMRTDWHRYNLKRRVAELPPLSSETFAEKVLNAQASNSAVAAKASYTKFCEACQRRYYSENQYENHLRGQRHGAKAAAFAKTGETTAEDETASVLSSTISLGEPINIVPIDDKGSESIDPEAAAEFSKVVNGIKKTGLDENEETKSKEPVSRRPTRPHHSAEEKRSEHPISSQDDEKNSVDDAEKTSLPPSAIHCLFCTESSTNLETNVQHMRKSHGLFIPEKSYLTDLEGLIAWLYEKVDGIHECLYCHKVKSSTEAIHLHMRDKGHCMIAFETEEEMIEVGQFYDFRSTYSDSEGSEDDVPGGVRLHEVKASDTLISDEDSKEVIVEGDEDDEGWETDGSDVSEGDTSLASKAQSTKNIAYQTENELHLPSGRTAGHRSLARYFRQNLHNYPTPAERFAQQRLLANGTADDDSANEERTIGNASTERGRQMVTRANGGLGMVGVTDAKKREARAVEKRESKRAQRAERAYQWGVDKKGNQQKHFRDPLLQ